MNALRTIVQQDSDILTLTLPKELAGRRLEVLVFSVDEESVLPRAADAWREWAGNGSQGPLDSDDAFPA